MSAALSIMNSSSNSDDHESLSSTATESPLGRSTGEKKAASNGELAKSDTQQVYLSMLAVLLLIAVTAGVVLGFTVLFLDQAEQDEFQHGFQQQANVISEASKFHAVTVQASLQTMSDSITSFTTFTEKELNYTWPYITVPDFARRGERAREEAYLEMIAFSPIVSQEDRHEWALYSNNNDDWLGGSNTNASSGIASEIYNMNDVTGHPEADSTSPSMIPVWQSTPKPNDSSLVNFNILSEPLYNTIFQTMRQVNHMTMSAVYRDDHVARTFFDPAAHDSDHQHHDQHLGMGAAHGDTASAGHEDHDEATASTEHQDHTVHGMGEDSDADAPDGSFSGMNHNDHTMSSATPAPSQPTVNEEDHSDHTMAMASDTAAPSESGMNGEDHSGHRRLSSEDDHSGHHTPSSDQLWAYTRPHSLVMAPVYDSFNQGSRSLKGVIHGILAWEFYLTELLPPGVSGIVVVLGNSCDQQFTFVLEGAHAEFIGDGDLHDSSYDNMYEDVEFGSFFVGEDDPEGFEQCFYSMRVYPSKEFQETFQSDDTTKFTALLAVVFAVLALFFLIFVLLVQRRQRKVVGVATRTTAIISNLFPEEVRHRIMQQAEAQAKGEDNDMVEDEEANQNLKNLLQKPAPPSSRTFGFATPSKEKDPGSGNFVGGIKVLDQAPIADLYPDCTVFFADIVGFTSWSSKREPSAVFVLLETLYGELDRAASRRRVFKVETIGDCYVAVTGLPKPRRDHATAMARFAADSLAKSRVVFKALAPRLGDDTLILDLRLGIHSGPVTAGVLRGEKGRFQLFGDTVNTAARMESSSRPGSIHCSQATADLLTAGDHSSWLTERPDKINPKGKGEMTSFWVHPKGRSDEERSQCSALTANDSEHASSMGTAVSHDFTRRSSLRQDPNVFSQRISNPNTFEDILEV